MSIEVLWGVSRTNIKASMAPWFQPHSIHSLLKQHTLLFILFLDTGALHKISLINKRDSGAFLKSSKTTRSPPRSLLRLTYNDFIYGNKEITATRKILKERKAFTALIVVKRTGRRKGTSKICCWNDRNEKSWEKLSCYTLLLRDINVTELKLTQQV